MNLKLQFHFFTQQSLIRSRLANLSTYISNCSAELYMCVVYDMREAQSPSV